MWLSDNLALKEDINGIIHGRVSREWKMTIELEIS
jgi:hypothetical protein